MTLILLYLVVLILVAIVLFGIASVVFGRGEPLPPLPRATTATILCSDSDHPVSVAGVARGLLAVSSRCHRGQPPAQRLVARTRPADRSAL